jgi:hypothetical protein
MEMVAACSLVSELSQDRRSLIAYSALKDIGFLYGNLVYSYLIWTNQKITGIKNIDKGKWYIPLLWVAEAYDL